MNIQGFLNAVLKQDAECLFSAAKISQLKNTAEFAYQQTSLIVCRFSFYYETAENKHFQDLKIFSNAYFK